MRITKKDLENVVSRLNKIAGFDSPEYSTVGSYCLDWAYGGVKLDRYTNTSGGVMSAINSGFVPKRDLYYRMQAYMNGLNETRS